MSMPRLTLPKLKGTPVRKPGGQAFTSMEVEKTTRSGEKQTLAASEEVHEVTPAVTTTGDAFVGSEMHVTIPGPPKSYKTVRIGASVYIPCETDDKSISNALSRADALAQQHLEGLAAEAHKFLSEG